MPSPILGEEIVAPTEAIWNTWQIMGETLGMIATLCFTVQYAPQAYKNYKRKSCRGFSSSGIIIKLVGAAFLMVNAYLLGETLSVTFYGLFNVIQHSIFMLQFAIYKNDYKFMVWLLFPCIPLFLGLSFAYTIPSTNSIKPVAQVFSHIPQLMVCYNSKSTQGVSLDTQHLNMVGGVCGLIMCFLITPKSSVTYFLYINSMFQAISLYAFAVKFDKYKFCFGERHIKEGGTDIESDGVGGVGGGIDGNNLNLENEPFIAINKEIQTHNNPRAIYSENVTQSRHLESFEDQYTNHTGANDMVVV